jgi:membrane-bound lytic murein transglycosylase F
MFIIKHKHHRVNLRLLAGFVVFLSIIIIYHEVQIARVNARIVDYPQIKAKGELRALTLYSSASYFIYRDKEMGYEYEICSRLADSLGLKLKMVVAPNSKALVEMLERGEGDLVAYNLPITIESKKKYLYCGREFMTHQVLVQQQKNPLKMVNDVTDLIGKTVVVQKGSRYYTRLKHLDDEIGGGIKIRTVDVDSLSEEDLIGMVAMGDIDFTVVDDNIAQFNKTFYKNVNTSLMISFSQHSSWMVRKTSHLLAQTVDKWFKKNLQSNEYKSTTKRYFELSKGPSPYLTTGLTVRHDGSISSFDRMFKKYAKQIDWDWRLLASISYQESNFDPSAENWAGAKGLMQIMPKTAHILGLHKDSLFDPKTSIRGAVNLLRIYERNLAGVKNKEQRQKLTIAAYNCGFGHIIDARALARKYKKNPNKWDGDNVAKCIYLKSLPEFYQDPVCKQGYLRGSETAQFVTEVWMRYKHYVKKGAR